jgi:dihydrofolate synthase / folylpolyglutamate synthase
VRYEQAIEYLYALAPRGMSLGLRPIRRALALRGNPERGFLAVHVAGTNGKGSVSAMIASVLSASGLRVGLFTSPHLHRLVERFRIDGRAMATRELARRTAELRSFLEQPRAPRLTFFEVCTLLAFEWFRDARCDVAVIEVGIGGRLDSTNVITPKLSVITSVALDHQDKLGATLRAIAREKAGIIKPGVPVVTGVLDRGAASVIARRAARLRAPEVLAQRAQPSPGRSQRHAVRWRGHDLSVRIPLTGDYQAENLGCAVAALAVLEQRGMPITTASLSRGLARVRWPGRLELLKGAPDVLCDAAHNPAAARALSQHVATLATGYTRKVLLFGVLKDKDYEEMLRLLMPHFDACVFATPASPRALLSADLRARFGGAAFNSLDTALKHAQKRATPRGLVVAAGSIFLMSAVRARVLGLREDPKIAL